MPETMTEQTAAPSVPNQMPTPNCATQKCKRPLTRLKDCWRCLVCNPFPEPRKTEEKKRKYIDVTMTEEMVREIVKEESGSAIDEDKIREIVRDELADWHIQKPPVTATEVAEATGVGGESVHISVKVPKPETWLQKAKRIGVKTHRETGGLRMKVDIMADMEAKEHPIISEEKLLENIEKVDKKEQNVLAEAKETEESPEGDNNDPPATAEKGN